MFRVRRLAASGVGRGARAPAPTTLQSIKVRVSENAFAAILTDVSVVTWGNRNSGGDSGAVQDQLKDVQQIQASEHVFAPIRSHWSVVTSGNRDCRGDSRAVQDQLIGVQQIQGS